MNNERKLCSTVCIKNEVYVFSGIGNIYDYTMSVEKYSPATNTWVNIAHMYDERIYFSACSFMNNVYFIGGLIRYNRTTSCIEFNTKDHTWREIARMNDARSCSACAVFEGIIVVSGGFGQNETLNTVEAYDYVADSWSHMPNMIETRARHKSVAIKNKLFVVGGIYSTTCEVFDSTCNKFALLKLTSHQYRPHLNIPAEVVSIGTNLVVFSNQDNIILFYDVKNGVWSSNTLGVPKTIMSFACTKVPQI